MANYNLREVLKQLGRNILSWVKSNCVNNCVSTTTNLPLAAAQGKVLQDQITTLNSNIVVVNLPQPGFTWQQSYIWRKQYTVPDGYTLEGIEVYSTNGDATLSGIYRSIDNAMYICVTGTYLDSTAWVVKPITNSYNFVCNVRLRKVNN